MNNISQIAKKQLLSFNLNEYPFPSISDEEWEALGVNPFKDIEGKKHPDAEQLTYNINQA